MRSVLKLFLAFGLFAVSCKESDSVFDPGYEPSQPTPVITSIDPAVGYLAGVDSIVVNGENFATSVDSMTADFGGVAGRISKASSTRLVVKPGYNIGPAIPVRVSVRGAVDFSNAFEYPLADPFNFYPGTDADLSPTSPFAIDGSDNIYTIVNDGGSGSIRYVRISTDGTVTFDTVKDPTQGAPLDSTMRFTQYNSIEFGPNNRLYLAQQGTFAIFEKEFGDGLREKIGGGFGFISSRSSAKFFDIIFDNRGFLWVVGSGTNEIHRFNTTTKAETRIPFTGELTAVALYDNFLFVGGSIDGNIEIWRFDVSGAGALSNQTKYFDFGANYSGTIADMVIGSNGDIIIATRTEENSLVRVFADGTHEIMYEDVTKANAAFLTWRSDRFVVVGTSGTEPSINFLDSYDKSRDGIYGF